MPSAGRRGLRSCLPLAGSPVQQRFRRTPFLLIPSASISVVRGFIPPTFRRSSLRAWIVEPHKRGRRRISVGTMRRAALHTMPQPSVAGPAARKNRLGRLRLGLPPAMQTHRPNNVLQTCGYLASLSLSLEAIGTSVVLALTRTFATLPAWPPSLKSKNLPSISQTLTAQSWRPISFSRFLPFSTTTTRASLKRCAATRSLIPIPAWVSRSISSTRGSETVAADASHPASESPFRRGRDHGLLRASRQPGACRRLLR